MPFFLFVLFRTYMRRVKSDIRHRILTQQAERERVNFEAHDTLIQSLQGLILLFDSISAQMPRDTHARVQIDFALARAEEVLEMDRNLQSKLLPSLDTTNDVPDSPRTSSHR